MSLVPGTRLGAYEILSAIGAGGMGEVYRARDTRLQRVVAIKVLPSLFAADSERLARFEREAQVLASLNHSHIAQIHGLEDSGPVRALVMELVEGEDLAQRIARGPIPVDEALTIAKQLVEALEAAHEQGIVHRDLKPGNIRVTPAGEVKVLDFGLAKAFESPGDRHEVANSPTITSASTCLGVILGTAPYMAPEQACGKRVDKRADIWAFGCVLYEMLTGKPAFGGSDVTEILASVVKSEPDWDALPVSTPPHVRRLVERCLQKDPKQRLRDIGDARLGIDERTESAPPRATEKPRRWSGWALGSALGLVAGVAAGIALKPTRPAEPRPLMRLALDLGQGSELASEAVGHLFAVSPDGTRLALVVNGAGGTPQLAMRLLRESAATPLTGTEGAQTPFFSPDGQWVGFWAGGKLKKISVSGGAAIELCDAPALRGASWGDDGRIVAALSVTSGLVRIPAEGGTPEPLTHLKTGERTHRWPHVLPGSRAVLFTSNVASAYDEATIDMVSLPRGERKTVHRGGFYGRYLPSGHLVYAHKSTLFGVRFDLERLALAGTPVPILDDAVTNPNAGAYFAASPTGSFLYLTATGPPSMWTIQSIEPSGRPRPLLSAPGRYFSPRLSPDGKRMAFSIQGTQGEDIWVKDLERGTLSRVSFLSGQNRSPVWTPDSRSLVFRSTDPARPGLYWVRSDGLGEAVRLTETFAAPSSFSPDGKRLALAQPGIEGSIDLFVAPMESDGGRPRLGKLEVFQGTRFEENNPSFSPDGRWIAYGSAESGRFEIYVRPFPGPGGRWQISTSGGMEPQWSRTGRELLFQAPPPGRLLMAVSYTVDGNTFVAGQPRVWSQVQPLAEGGSWDLAPDGRRVAALGSLEDASTPVTKLVLMLNFFEEVRRRVGDRSD